jgi:ribose transport system permease protein
MKKALGVLLLLCVVVAATSVKNPNFLNPGNVETNLRWTGLYAIIAIGEAIVIITGGIDLSVGSVIGLTGALFPMLLVKHEVPVWMALPAVLGLSMAIGVLHGLLITKLRLQPFLVTLCGLFFYRGIARYMTGDETQGFGSGFHGLKDLAKGTAFEVPMPRAADLLAGDWKTDTLGVPMPFVLMIVIALVASSFLNLSIYGRYLLALGRNEQAARYSGIATDRIVILAYCVSAALAGLSGILFALDTNSIQPSTHGNFYELYAIAPAVLGGCSLRGGEGSILGVVIGAAVIRVLYNAINLVGIETQLEFAVIGIVILFGVVADELVKRIAARRRAKRSVG